MSLDYKITAKTVNGPGSTGGRYVTIGEAAKLLDVSIDTVRRWEKSGKLQSLRLDGKNRHFLASNLEAYKNAQPLSTTNTAHMLGVSVSTVRRLECQNLLVPERDQSGRRQYSQTSVRAYLAYTAEATAAKTITAPQGQLGEAVVQATPTTTFRLKQRIMHRIAPLKLMLQNDVPAQSDNYFTSSSLLFFLLLMPLLYVTTSVPGTKQLSIFDNAQASLRQPPPGQLNHTAALTLPSSFFLQPSDSGLTLNIE